MSALSPAYREIRRQRSNGNVAGALEALERHRPASDADAFEAVICLFVCGQLDNAVHVSRTFKWQSAWASNAAGALARSIEAGDPSRGLEAAERAANDANASTDAAALYLLLLQQSGALERAEAFIERRFPDPPPGETLLLTVIAETMLALGRWRDAYRAATGVLSSDPDDLRTLFVLSEVNLQIGNFHEALGHAVRAHHLQKGAPATVLQLMRCRNRLGQYYGTLAAYDGLAPGSATDGGMHIELGRAYVGIGKAGEAISHFNAALAAADDHRLQALRALSILQASGGDAEALRALKRTYGQLIENDSVCLYWIGIAALNGGALHDAQRCFEQTARLAEARGAALNALPWPVPEPRLRHDREQLELLGRRGKLDPAGRAALDTLRRQKGGATPDSTFAPDGKEAEALAHALCTHFHRPQSQWAGRALGENDYGAIEAQYRMNRVVVIDDFLSPAALTALRSFCEEATIWRMHYARGYVGATLEQGFSPGVLLALAAELRAAMPQVIGETPLTQAWAYKYDQRQQGINMHADFADVNVNFWITPDEACEDPDRSGMIVYDLPVPANWTFYEYNNDPEKLAAYVRVHGAKAQRIAYRANRCVLFDSSLIHITDELHFRPGYENRRVNVTLLYGRPRHVD